MPAGVNGRFVTFISYAGNLAPGDTNGAGDIYVRDRVAGTTVRAGVADEFRKDLRAGTVIRASRRTGGAQGLGDPPGCRMSG
ncbi:hypothetical protein Ato02nite_082940 [Paractinoplanes toevensis]|uniref:Uncharacterized protein n=1 Tax=Paractinoplanes toevensis TaxID=571911 RepID=A0A919WA90_9ACTN|nr:hypothetical protein Ato02nite_082940 [Actinoplanes toevensis]